MGIFHSQMKGFSSPSFGRYIIVELVGNANKNGLCEHRPSEIDSVSPQRQMKRIPIRSSYDHKILLGYLAVRAVYGYF